MRALLPLLLIVPAGAIAQDDTPKPEREVRYMQRQVVEFDRGLELEGELVRPRISVFAARADGVFNPLIKLRKNFDLEVLQSAGEVR